jgi:DUF1680 family protein
MDGRVPFALHGLVEMYRTTGDERYLKMAKTAIDLRDSVENGTDDNQDRIPLREHRKIVGHAVRSTYLTRAWRPVP